MKLRHPWEEKEEEKGGESGNEDGEKAAWGSSNEAGGASQ